MNELSLTTSNLDRFCEENIKMPYPRMWFRNHYITLGGTPADAIEEIKSEYDEWLASCEHDQGCD